ncbi:MAG: chorismate-binding protein [Bacteroidales bacterium]|jgi:isochorismate synthase|nr:hypothetical protein [Lentimicrobiaceae bacterium]MDG1136271.1 chorismate-binding protein [Bacteroidales bacterium]MDG1901384.1 chorismate-binding protein [Bacteroidales bacterium]MDG2080918.1 chorismate-binding protein [Bacteroidales bacterium]|tara:strand:- start:12296 stop:13432 length:1137 start_codon:yes stop_codon:yes gene_type:complete
MQNVLEISNLVISKGLPCAIYSLPGEDKFTLVFQNTSKIQNIEIIDIKSTSGFIIADFESAQTGIAKVIKPENILNDCDNLENIVGFLSQLPQNSYDNYSDNISISKQDYIDRTSFLISKLANNDLKKVVFSRIIPKKLSTELHIPSLLKLMRDKYPDAFINLFHLPGEGIWFGASPETLIRINGDTTYTDALAGTKSVDKENHDPIWTIKEKEEQRMVTLFIESLLSELGVDKYDTSGHNTHIAGNVAHIQTKFKISTASLINKEGRFIVGLHPTPAVCGLPKADAYLLIKKAEQHQRRYYTGFIGPWQLKKTGKDDKITSELFVNLRCAELGKTKINIYVGGGITAASNPYDEYEETVHKSKTLLSVVENLQKFAE